MSERQEHRKRLNSRIMYAAAIERWAEERLTVRCAALWRRLESPWKLSLPLPLTALG